MQWGWIRALCVCATTATALAMSPVAMAAPPNDEFANAMPITSFPFTHSLDTAGAGLSPGEQNICGSKRVLWYRFSPGTTTRVFATAVSSASRYGNPYMVAFTLPAGGLHVEAVACDEDPLYFLAEAGTTYYIGLGMRANGPLDFAARQVLPATNDDFDNARPITSFPYVDLGNGHEATRALDEPTNSCEPSYGSVWYRYTNVSPHREPIRFTPLPGFYSTDTSVTIYTGSRGSLTKVGCGTTTGFTAMPATTYHLLVEGGSVEYNPGWPLMVQKSLFRGYLTLKAVGLKVRYGNKLRMSAHLRDFAEVSRHVSIYGTAAGGARKLVASGVVNSSGTFTARLAPKKHTTYEAEWSGGPGYTTAVSPPKQIKVVAKVETRLKGAYGRSGSDSLYHSGANPVLIGTVRPNHAGRRVQFRLEVQVGGRWYFLAAADFKLGRTSKAAAYVPGPREGYRFRARTTFRGDKDHLGGKSPWAYFRVTG